MRKAENSTTSNYPDWTPVFEIQRTLIIHNYKTFQRNQFPVTPASGKTFYKAGATVDRVVVDLSQGKDKNGKDRKHIMPHMHYVQLHSIE